jgi:hypothetical protein
MLALQHNTAAAAAAAGLCLHVDPVSIQSPSAHWLAQGDHLAPLNVGGFMNSNQNTRSPFAQSILVTFEPAPDSCRTRCTGTGHKIDIHSARRTQVHPLHPLALSNIPVSTKYVHYWLRVSRRELIMLLLLGIQPLPQLQTRQGLSKTAPLLQETTGGCTVLDTMHNEETCPAQPEALAWPANRGGIDMV